MAVTKLSPRSTPATGRADSCVNATSTRIDPRTGRADCCVDATGSPVEPGCAKQAPALIEPIGPRLLDVEGAAAYLGVSTWTVRDYVANGTIPAVRLPAARIDMGRRRGGKGRRYELVPHGDPRLGSREPVRRILVDVRDLDALIDRSKMAALPVEDLLRSASAAAEE